MLAAARRDAASHSSTGRRWHHLWRLLLFQKCLLGCDALLNECSAEEHVEKKENLHCSMYANVHVPRNSWLAWVG